MAYFFNVLTLIYKSKGLPLMSDNPLLSSLFNLNKINLCTDSLLLQYFELYVAQLSVVLSESVCL